MPLTKEQGPLILCKGSHKWPEYDRLINQTEEIPFKFAEFAPKTQWHSCSNMKMGDFIIFHNKVLHGSLKNQSTGYRVSVDTRWATKDDFEILNFPI